MKASQPLGRLTVPPPEQPVHRQESIRMQNGRGCEVGNSCGGLRRHLRKRLGVEVSLYLLAIVALKVVARINEHTHMFFCIDAIVARQYKTQKSHCREHMPDHRTMLDDQDAGRIYLLLNKEQTICRF
jgi:hypothetical protein